MKYISLDIETTGLDPLTCDILEIGVYIEDTDISLPRERLPCFHKYLWKDNYRGEPFALSMNSHIIQKMLELKKKEGVGGMYDTNNTLIVSDCLWDHFSWWIYSHKRVWAGTPFGDSDANLFHVNPPKLVVAGKNVAGFDLPFLKQIKGCFPKFHHRVIDPGMMYFNPLKDDVPPDLKECKKRAGLPDIVSHEALDDAWDVIQLIRFKFSLI